MGERAATAVSRAALGLRLPGEQARALLTCQRDAKRPRFAAARIDLTRIRIVDADLAAPERTELQMGVGAWQVASVSQPGSGSSPGSKLNRREFGGLAPSSGRQCDRRCLGLQRERKGRVVFGAASGCNIVIQCPAFDDCAEVSHAFSKAGRPHDGGVDRASCRNDWVRKRGLVCDWNTTRRSGQGPRSCRIPGAVRRSRRGRVHRR